MNESAIIIYKGIEGPNIQAIQALINTSQNESIVALNHRMEGEQTKERLTQRDK